MHSWAARAILRFTPFLLLSIVAFPVAAQDVACDPGDVEVRALKFAGNAAFTDTELARVIVTTPSPFARRVLRLPFTVRRCLDRTELPRDRARLVVFYRRRGFPDAAVDTAVSASGTNGVEVKFAITEGLPTILQSLIVRGLDSVPDRAAITRDLPVGVGDRFDRVTLDAARDTVARRLRNSGYPRAQVSNAFSVEVASRAAFDTLTVTPGPFTRIGRVNIEVVPFESKGQQISDAVVRRVVGLDSGRVYRENDLLDAQRTLYRTEAYQHVTLVPDSATSPSDSTIGINALLVENTTRSARLGAGYGTLDCFRVTGELSNYNFLARARRLDLTARVSKIGIGEPLGGARELCPQAKRDPFSAKLNYYAGATLRQPVFFGLRAVPTITVFSERISEYNAYLRTTAIGGIASLEWRRFTRTPVTFGYSMDLGRTEAQPALFCAVFNLCDREDRQRVQQTQRLAVLSAVVSRDNSNSFISPTRGSQWRVETRHASKFILSDTALQFNKVLAERSQYWGTAGGAVIAFRLRGGAVFGRTLGSATGFIPPQERLYAGGPTSVRGFSQNELGSAIYIANSYRVVLPAESGLPDTLFRASDTVGIRRAVPVGGNTLVVANLELRLRSPFYPDLLQWTLFTDAGDVYNRGRFGSFQNFSIKVTPGVQLTAFSPVGPIRIVVGYNPYDRPSGPLYFEVPRDQGTSELLAEPGALPCVSPRNVLPVRRDGDVLRQAEGRCSASFTPRTDRGFLRRLTFGLAIGQAF
ncbi:MAG: BamA/TamA family outer membrane protein [Gemmatimonadaceae bacterium]